MRPVSGISLEEAGGHREAAGLGGDQAVCPDPGDAGVREGVPGAPPPLRHACLHRGRGQSSVWLVTGCFVFSSYSTSLACSQTTK